MKISEEFCIFRCLGGSHAYGTASEASDLDIRGIGIAPPSQTISCLVAPEQEEDKEKDIVIFELRKFMLLAQECNPNIIELLFTPDENILFIEDAFRKIREHRHLFLSTKAKHTFSGYAMAQMKRIKGHHKWISNPQPEETPKLSDFCNFVGNDGLVRRTGESIRDLAKTCFLAETFGTTQFRVYRSPDFFKDKLGFFSENEFQVRFVDIPDDVLSSRAEYVGMLIINLNEFKSRHKDWSQYWEWKKNRNEVRARLEELHGFDTKHAMHLVRLMRMAQEILETGQVIVRRPDAAELLRIRNGEFDYDWLNNWAAETDAKLDELYKTSSLQHDPQRDKIDALYREVVLDYWKRHGLLY